MNAEMMNGTTAAVNAVIQTRCPACDAEPGYACYPNPEVLREIFHAARLLATRFEEIQ